MKPREIAIVLRNLVLGVNLETLPMLANPREMVSVVTECLFLSRCVHPNGHIPQRQVWEALGAPSEVSVKLYADAASEWFRPSSFVHRRFGGDVHVVPNRPAKIDI